MKGGTGEKRGGGSWRKKQEGAEEMGHTGGKKVLIES